MISPKRVFFPVVMLVLFLAADRQALGQDQAAKDTLIVEAILRLENFDYTKAPERVTGAVTRYLKANPGSDEFFKLIATHQLKGHIDLLVEVAAGSDPERGARAADLALALGGGEALVNTALAVEATVCDRLLRGLGFAGRPEAIDLLVEILKGDHPKQLRVSGIRALGGSKAGEKALVSLASEQELPADLTLTAATVLHQSVDPAIREEAAKHLEMPASADSKPLPPLPELARRRGDAKKGKEVYRRSCLICHQIGDEGINFGPALTEIGDKLAKEALYTAILDPNEAISFGFEGVRDP